MARPSGQPEKPADVASRLHGLSAAKRELLMRRLAQRREQAPGSDEPPLVRVQRDGPMPLSFAERRLWFVDQYEPGQATYNLPYALRLRGALNIAALQGALNELVRRHEPLRTRFVVHGDEPMRMIDPATPLPLNVLSLDQSTEAEREALALAWVKREAHRPFDLSLGPIFRSELLRLNEADHILLLMAHHIVSDGWSLDVLGEELWALYRAPEDRRSAALTELSIQYADYAVWQRRLLQGDTLRRQLSFWTECLTHLPTLDLPTDRPRPPTRTSHGAVIPFELSHELVQRIRALSQREGATVFMTTLAAFGLLLGRWSGEDYFAVGTPVAGRTRVELEPLVGLFVNSLVLRIDLQGQPTARELLARARDMTLSAYAHQDVPIERLVEELQPARDSSRTPLFQVMFTLENRRTQIQAPGLGVALLPIDGDTSKFDLSLFVSETDTGLGGVFEYSTDLFVASTVERMAGHLRVLLEGMTAEPDRCIHYLSMLTDSEQRRIVIDWNSTRAEYPADRQIQGLFEEQAARTPTAIAVRFGGQVLDYATLDARSDNVAARLRELGVVPDAVVGLCVRRSLDLVVAVLGVLKAGGAYVPLDPEYPADRLGFMQADCGAKLILTQRALSGKIGGGGTRLFLDELDAWPSSSKVSIRGHGAQLAYVIYTSGSTGRPKGVMVTRGGLGNYLSWCTRAYDAHAGSGAPVHSPLGFDLTVTSLFVPLLTGAQVVLLAEDRGAEALATELRSKRAYSLVKITPAHLDALRELVPGDSAAGGTRVFVIGGEQLTWESCAFWRRNAPETRLVNEYGPTETVVGCCTYEVGSEAEPSGAIPIGRPIANTQLYVLDGRFELTPAGVLGELVIGGAGVARGYVSRAGLTGERFVPNPFGAPGTRLYRTGDVARWADRGVLEFIGRKDAQIKLRGYRIELGEVESVLQRQPGVRECVVVARADAQGSKRLVAYVTPETVDAAELRDALRTRLPEYMIPSVFVGLPALPLTPNGKVDRKALPAPGVTQTQREYVAPRSPVEQLLANTWSELLHVERVGIHDSFFELGGHSLLATQVVARIRQALGTELPVRTLFEAPTIAQLAVETQRRQGHVIIAEPPLTRVPRDGPLALSFAQERLWFLDRLEPNSAGYNVPGALRLVGCLNVPALRQSLNEIVRRHEALRTRFEEKDGQAQQSVDGDVKVELPVVDLRASIGRDELLRTEVRDEAHRPFDLAKGPVLRAKLLWSGEEEHILLLTMHHIVSDGWSFGIFVRELSTLYAAFADGQASPLPELPIQYVDYAYWQRLWLQGEVLERQLGYWRKQLEGAPAALPLPTDRPRPAFQSYRGGMFEFRLDEKLTQRLQEVSRAEGATMFMTLVTVFAVLLSRYSGQEDLVLGSPIANRTRAETEGLIGFFVNTLPLRLSLSGAPSIRQLLGRVKQIALDAYMHQDIPFERLVAELNPVRDLSRTPLFQVMFVLQNASAARLKLTGLSLEPFEVEDEIAAKFDLTLAMGETPANLLAGVFEYNVDLFDRSTIGRLTECFRGLLTAAAIHPDRVVTHLSLLTEGVRHELLVEWNDTRVSYPNDRGIHKLFSAQASQTPKAIALICDNRRLTYEELDAWSSELANRLRKLNVGPEVLVGVCLERSLEMVVGVLGVLKASGAYVPIEPTMPLSRMMKMLRSSGVELLLTHSALTHLVDLPVKRVLLDDRSDAAQSAAYRVTQIRHENLAYVIHTSGSTGQPKGVGISHGALAHFTEAARARLEMRGEDRILQFASLSFDASVEEIFPALTSGGTLVVRSESMPLVPSDFMDRCVGYGITVLALPTAFWHELVDAEVPLPRSVRLVIIGGERAIPEKLRRWLDRYPSYPKLVNTYGPTETTVEATSQDLRTSIRSEVPIGRPLPGATAYILDGEWEPVPIGVKGQLYVGGVGLARGYVDAPEPTAERFVPDPFGSRAGRRMYATGDLATWLADGQIEFRGRSDDQVKIRGYRIELEEIERTLAEHPCVRAVVVVVREVDGNEVTPR
jgi:amino acid adenylation domain-containing protein